MWVLLAASVALAGCGAESRAPKRCRNLVEHPNFETGWNIGSFARPDEAAAAGVRALVITGAAEGPIAQLIKRPGDVAGAGVVAIGYARVETSQPLPTTDEDVTAQLWQGTVNLMNGYSRNGRDFDGVYTRLRFTGREVASGYWKRFVTEPIPVRRAPLLYPHFAFWGTRLAAGVKLRVAAVSLVEAGYGDSSEPESWAACPALPAPNPSLESATRRQWENGLEPNGAFDDAFTLTARRAADDPRSSDLLLNARYRQGSQPADRFLVAVTEDGSDPRLSPTSRVTTVLARRGAEQWGTTVRVKTAAKPLAVAVAAAALTEPGLRAQTPLLPTKWQRSAGL